MRPEPAQLLLGLAALTLGCGPAVSIPSGDAESSSSSATNGPDATGSPTTAPGSTSTGTTAPAPPADTGVPEPTTAASTGGDSGGSSTSPVVVIDLPPPIVSCSKWDDCEKGEKCVAWSSDGSGVWDARRCSPVGTDVVGDPCTVVGGPASGVDSCARGSMCWSVDPDTNTGTCQALCVGNENAQVCDDPTTTCITANEGSLNLCLPTCSPLSPLCPIDEACYGTDNALVCIRPGTPLAAPPDEIFPAFCPPGSTAIRPELDVNCEDDELCCAPWCDVTMFGNCPNETVCDPWFEEGTVWFNDAGVCINVP